MKKLLLSLLLFSTTANAAYNPNNPNGQSTMANSSPVAISSDQSSLPVTGTFWQATQPVSGTLTCNAGTGTLATSLASLPALATGANTIGAISNTAFTANAGTNLNTSLLALESGGNLASINTKLPSQGQALAAASLPVVLTAAQMTTLTPLSSVTVTQGTGTNLHTVVDSAPTTAVTGTFWQATQPVSGTLTCNAGSGTMATSLASLPALATGTNTIGSVKLTDGTSVSTILNLTNNKALTVGIVDGSGTQITSFGGGTQYAQGTTQASPTGTVAMGKNPSNVINSLALDASGNLNVNVAAGSGGNGAASATGAAVPAQADYTGFNSGGNLVGVSSGNPFPVSLASLPALATGANAIGSITNTSFAATQATASSLNMTDATGALAQGTVAAGTAATKSVLVGAVYNSTPITLTNGQGAANQSDSFGNLNVILPDQFITGQSAQTATINNIIPATASSSATDASGYKSGSLQLVSTATGGTLIMEGSNDNATFVTLPIYQQLNSAGNPIVAAFAASGNSGVYIFPINTRYIRFRIAGTLTGGSAQVFTKLTQGQYSPANLTATQATASNLNVNATVASGTLTGVTTVSTVTTTGTVTTLANGQTAHSSASTGSPLRVGGRVVSTLDTTLAQGDASDLAVTTGQQLVTKAFATSENDWQASSGTTPLATTTLTAMKAAGAASIRNFVSGCQFYNSSATVSTTVQIVDGASTVIWTGYLPATTAALPVMPVQVVFQTPLRGTAATAMNIQLGTTASSVYYNCQGYQSF